MKSQYKDSRFDDSIVDAMLVSNALNKQNSSKEKFTATDAIIMSIVHELWCSEGKCTVSNKYLSERALITQPTIQKSINKLCKLDFISKNTKYVDGKHSRTIIYNQDVVEEFKSRMNSIILDYEEGIDE